MSYLSRLRLVERIGRGLKIVGLDLLNNPGLDGD